MPLFFARFLDLFPTFVVGFVGLDLYKPLTNQMMRVKRMLTYVALVFVLVQSLTGIAQEAPDFAVTDLEGLEHHLYDDYLDQGKVVVLAFFYMDAPMIDVLYPALQAYAIEEWSNQTPVDFILLSHADAHAALNYFAEDHNLVLTISGVDGGAPAAIAPYIDGSFGPFFGYPMFVVIGPSGEVVYDPWGESYEAIISAIDDAVKSFVGNVNVANLEAPEPEEVYSDGQALVVKLPESWPFANLHVYSLSGQLLGVHRLPAGCSRIQHPIERENAPHAASARPWIYLLESEGKQVSGKFFH